MCSSLRISIILWSYDTTRLEEKPRQKDCYVSVTKIGRIQKGVRIRLFVTLTLDCSWSHLLLRLTHLRLNGSKMESCDFSQFSPEDLNQFHIKFEAAIPTVDSSTSADVALVAATTQSVKVLFPSMSSAKRRRNSMRGGTLPASQLSK